MRADIVPGGIFRLRADRPHQDPTPAGRAAGDRPDDPGPLARRVLPEGPPAAPRAGRQLPEDPRRLRQIVTISTDNTLKTNEFRDSVGAQWTFLSDAGHKIQKDLDIQQYTDS